MPQTDKTFRYPPTEFRPAAFWFWNRIPEAAEIRRGIADMKAKGFSTFMIQARLSLPLSDYLSPEWIEACRIAFTEAKALGMQAVIYDEYNWMSGHGGGHTVAGADHLRERHLFWTKGRVAEAGPDGRLELTVSEIRSPFLEFLGPAGLAWCYEGGKPLWDEWRIVASIGRGGGARETPELREVPAEIVSAKPDGCRIAVDTTGLPDGPLTVFASARCRSSRPINYLLPEAAERFAELVYAPLAEAAEAAGEDVARAFFFDHPYAGFYRWAEHEGALGNSLLWSGELEAETETVDLMALVGEIGPETATRRHGFFARYSARLHEAFFGTLRRWCDRRGFELAGHELLTHVGKWGLREGLSGIDPRVMPGVDYFGVDTFRTTTAVDAADYVPQLAARLGDSVARASGRSRCIVEQYATGREVGRAGLAGQWDLTLERLRAQAIRHTLMGARQFLFHAVYLDDGTAYHEDGRPNLRYDFPPGINFEPWWEDCPEVFEEIARLSAFLEEGEPLRRVALLYPLAALWQDGGDAPCARQFGWWAKALAEAGIGYDVVDERSLATGMVEDGHLVTRAGRYHTLVLPDAHVIGQDGAVSRLRALLDGGGRLVASGRLPRPLHPTADDAGEREALAPQPSLDHLPEPDEAAVAAAVATIEPPRPWPRISGGPSWNWVSRHGDAWRIVVFNDGDAPRALELLLDEPDVEAARWDPVSGRAAPFALPAARQIVLPAQALLCLEVRAAEGPRAAPAAAGHIGPPPLPVPIVLGDRWEFHTKVPGAEFQPVRVTEGWERQGWPAFSGTGIYRRRVRLPPLPAGLAWHLVLPRVRETVECLVDGRSLGRRLHGERRFRLDAEGEVEIELRIRNTAANRYYAGTPHELGGPTPSGLLESPRLEAGPEDREER
ncbi:hypothetical protein [Lutibaculum baratangense]|uniref:Uncharacterized protein n=1 Tax=Lutibaculum baratangense AMV1 TaxID=631454 RepID=V4R4Y6_9HYPH|nr:hypothetical protein [Lutibaculum baratangense]ESR27012.1 hypothetical protein N177_0438 [Lutibaculum baratangense AMV1]